MRLGVGGVPGRPPALRTAVVLVDVQRLPLADAARLLDISAGTVKSHCSRGRAHLALLLGYLPPGNPGAPPTVSEEGHHDAAACAQRPPDARSRSAGRSPHHAAPWVPGPAGGGDQQWRMTRWTTVTDQRRRAPHFPSAAGPAGTTSIPTWSSSTPSPGARRSPARPGTTSRSAWSAGSRSPRCARSAPTCPGWPR
ncbi:MULTISPECIES: sigma factor-like helix-turn-helix DNA-binding protein [Frankia]|uniref:sigma factor-like helix-turn-helix DNA-binding protein n=1 Tax=Frankia TaxID=1854 RepID=UPI0009E3C4B8|nr:MULTISPECIES: sigma factor-like helix-turn-helix DNA-binding protein [Frankia]